MPHLLRDGTGSAMAPIETPCILVCTMDEPSGCCAGCGRTREEIGGWLAMTPAERRAVMALLPGRLEAMRRPARLGAA
jgi:predicted Fe-S protein YdhL (DUF1289 family)